MVPVRTRRGIALLAHLLNDRVHPFGHLAALAAAGAFGDRL